MSLFILSYVARNNETDPQAKEIDKITIFEIFLNAEFQNATIKSLTQEFAFFREEIKLINLDYYVYKLFCRAKTTYLKNLTWTVKESMVLKEENSSWLPAMIIDGFEGIILLTELRQKQKK